jgi:hypothetical protein
MIPVLLSEGGLLDREFHHGLFDLRGDAVLQHRLSPADLLQGQLAAFVTSNFETANRLAFRRAAMRLREPRARPAISVVSDLDDGLYGQS